MTDTLAPNDERELAEKQRLANEIVNYSDKYADKVIILKAGGDVVGNDDSLMNIARDADYMVSKMSLMPLFLTGGGPQIDALSKERGIPKRIHPQTEFRITDAQTLEICREVMNNQIDRIARAFNKYAPHLKVLPMHGYTGRMVTTQLLKDHEYTGECVGIDTDAITTLMKSGFVPVMSSLGYHPELGMANVNADPFAGFLAREIKAERFLLMTNTDGIWDGEKKRIKRIELHEAENLLDQPYIQGGAKPKLKSLFTTVSSMLPGTSGSIINGHRPRAALMELLFEEGSGTYMEKPAYSAAHTPV